MKHIQQIIFALLIGLSCHVTAAHDPIQKLLESIYSQLASGFCISDEETKAVSDGGGSPTYGEIPYASAKELFDGLHLSSQDVFYDLGSGTGKMVLQAYLTTPMKKVVGIELSPTRHAAAEQAKKTLKKHRPAESGRELVFLNEDLMKSPIQDATLIYLASTCFPEPLMQNITRKMTACKPGLKVLTLKKLSTDTRFVLQKSSIVPMSWSPEVTVYQYELLPPHKV